jgi:mRNA interferase MazF
VVVQSDFFSNLESVTILPVTGLLVEEAGLLRITVEADKDNCLQKRSQIMIDKAHTMPRDRVGDAFGRLDDRTMLTVNRALAVFLGIA